MNPDLKKVLSQSRKNKRDSNELKALRQRLHQLKSPDTALIKQIDAELETLAKQP